MNYFQGLIAVYRTVAVDNTPPISFSDTDVELEKIKQLWQLALSSIFCEQWNFRKDLMTFQTVAGQASYDMPVGIIEKSGVSIAGNTYLLINEKAPYSLTVQSGVPQRYYVQGSKLVLHPTPTDARTVNVHYLHLMQAKDESGNLKAKMELETDVPNIPEQFHDLIVSKTELLYMRDTATRNSAQLKEDIKKRISQLTDLDRGTLEASPIIIL